MYWERDQEINLLWTVLEALDPGVVGHTGIADQIICGLIEMELVDCDRAPTAQQAWCDEWIGYDVDRDFIVKHYLIVGEMEDEGDG